MTEFTKYHSLNDILDYPHMEEYLKIFFSEDNLKLFPEETRHLPLALSEQSLVSPWGGHFSQVVQQLLEAVQTVLDLTERRARRCVSLWNEDADWTLEQEQRGSRESVFLLTPEYKKNLPRSDRKQADSPAVIICPGGGYEQVCFSGEGNPVMRYMEAKGYTAFVLKYRTAPARWPEPQEDLALAIRYVREHAREYGADPCNLMLMGFSAGGHLCASLGCFCRELAEAVSAETGTRVMPEMIRPDRLCLAYPVITFGRECHEGSFLALTGNDERLRETLSLNRWVTEDFPPAFLWACRDDDCVPASNAERMAEALRAKGIPHLLRLYPSGGHGCNLAFENSARGWTEEMVRFMNGCL